MTRGPWTRTSGSTEAEGFISDRTLGAFCLDVRTSTVCQLMGFPSNH